jgi:hypothetical protein
MSLYAVETETQTHTTTKHFIPYGKQLEGKQGRWNVSCGRLVRGEVWEAGSVDGVICKQCMKRQVELEEMEAERLERLEKVREKARRMAGGNQ